MQSTNSPSSISLKAFRNEANKEGIAWLAAIDPRDASRFDAFERWLDDNFDGSMNYLRDRREHYRNPRSILQSVRWMIVMAMPYAPAKSLRHKANGFFSAAEKSTNSQVATDAHAGHSSELGMGRVAAYAANQRDYHDTIHLALKKLKRWIIDRVPDASVRGVVDTAPLLERDYASQAGLGWIGKNTLLLRQDGGSYFFLATMLIDCELDEVDEVRSKELLQSDHCGTCTACLDACPTNAFPAAHVLDATRCISYLTIEHRGAIEPELRPLMGDWILGCDICQQVCPWNRMATEPMLESLKRTTESSSVSLLAILDMDEKEFRNRFRKTPLWRPGLEGIKRNAIIACANQNFQEATTKLSELAKSNNEMLSETASWALAELARKRQ